MIADFTAGDDNSPVVINAVGLDKQTHINSDALTLYIDNLTLQKWVSLDGTNFSRNNGVITRVISWETLHDRISAIAAVNHPAPNATTISVNDNLWLDDNAGNTSKWGVSGTTQDLVSSGNFTLDAVGSITLKGSTLNITNPAEDVEANACGINAGGYVGSRNVLSPLSILGISPADGEGQSYSTGFQGTAERWRYIHTWGTDWFSLQPSSNTLLAARVVNSSGLSVNMAISRTEYVAGVPTTTNIPSATIARLSIGNFGADTQVRVLCKGSCSQNLATGNDSKMVVKFTVYGTGVGLSYNAIYSEITCVYLIPNALPDYKLQIMSSVVGGISNRGAAWSYAKGFF
jgi:hypothetical protein